MNRLHTILLVILILSTDVVIFSCAYAPKETISSAESDQGGIHDGVIGFYRGPLNHLSGVRRGSCPMHPSCSQYSRQAVQRYGLTTGWVMTMDRLMRCGRDELKVAPRVFVDGTWKHYDPVDWNVGNAQDPKPLSGQVDQVLGQHGPDGPVITDTTLNPLPMDPHPAYQVQR